MDRDTKIDPEMNLELDGGRGKPAAGAAASHDTEPRLDKVKGLKAAIAAGTYHIKAELIAEGLLRSGICAADPQAEQASEPPLSALPN